MSQKQSEDRKYDSIRLQGLGIVPALPAGELRPGDVTLWNYGHPAVVLEVRTIGPATVEATLSPENGDPVYTRSFRRGRLVGVRPVRAATVDTLTVESHQSQPVDVGVTLHLRGRDGHLYEARITRRLSGDATIAQSQNQSDREELIEVLTAAFYEIATVDAGGEESGGWCCTNGRTTAVDYGERLVELGVFERDTTRGIGRVQWFRPIKTPA